MSLTNEQLLTTYTPEYIPVTQSIGLGPFLARPVFTMADVPAMLTDPRIQFGLWLIKGPIVSRSRFFVDCQNPKVKTFLIKCIDRFWRVAAIRALRAIEWGVSAHEVIYRQGQDGLIYFDSLRDFATPDVDIFSVAGRFAGFKIRNNQNSGVNFLAPPKAFTHVHAREYHPFYGRSRLYSVYVPWWEKWGSGGYRDTRRLWYFKAAFNGGVILYPPGSTKNEQGIVVPNRQIAQEIIEKLRSGGVLALPAPSGDAATPGWGYQPPEANASPSGLLEYGDKLNDEELEAMGIPPEIVQSGGDQGFGSSTGRQIPQEAFYSTLGELSQWLMHDANDQIFRFLVNWNFGQVEYEIIPFPLDKSGEQQPNYNGNQFQAANLDANNPAGQTEEQLQQA